MSCGSGCGCGPRKTPAPRGPGKRGSAGYGSSRSVSRSKSTTRTTTKTQALRSKSRGSGCGCDCGSRSRNRSKSRSGRNENARRSGSRKSDSGSRGRVVPIWKHLGPDPDLQELFQDFDRKYFWGVLSEHNVTVEWSKRLKSTIGSCSSEYPPKISISEPLIRQLHNRDLVETLLHEMIHAYLELNDDEYEIEEHGPNFHKHMKRIDKLTGTRLTVDHSFHREVERNQYQWRCDRCRKTIFHCYNKPPSSKDSWWADHLATCGGSFLLRSTPHDHSAESKRSPLSNIANMPLSKK